MGKESKDRRRSRSRDRDRKKSRSRSPRRDRKRSRSRDRDRRKKSRSPRRSRSRSPRRRSRSRDRRDKRRDDRDIDSDRQREAEKAAAEEEKKKNAEKEKEKAELEKIMQDRRARVAEWRERQRKRKLESGVVEPAPEEEEKKQEKEEQTDTKKGWSLEDEDDDEEDQKPVPAEASANGEQKNGQPEKMEVQEEEDPLDIFMNSVAQNLQKKRPVAQAGPRIIKINTAPTEEKNKGEILENEGRAEVVIDDIDLETATQSLCHKARLLNAADHTRIYYRPFTKNFYVETQEIAKMTKAQVRELREELDDIRVKGKGCPKPIKAWAQCGCQMRVLNQLKKLEYAKPTPIQCQAIPAIMAGRDVIGIAKTGSGKTLAFLLPMFRHIMDQDPLEDMDGPIALIMAPTRELCMQTWKEANKFAKVLNLRVVCAYGGVGISEQIADLKRGAEIIVCTPGRMIDLLVSNGGRVTNLRRVTYLVLDEADRMFDMGFEPQVMKIIDNIRPDRQTVLFSATFPRQMEALAQKVLTEPIEILVGGKSVVCSDVTQNVVICEEHQKALKLLELLGIYYEMGNVIIFVDRQEKADEICGVLIKSGYACAPLHGGIDQADRDSNIVDFKNGSVKILVATSVAARGLDVKNLLLVVNYDCPNHYEDYVHRVGRTGRAGNKGYAYTFILPEHQERMAGEICRAFESAGSKPPDELKSMFDRFVEEMRAQGKEVHLGGKGFSGSGYKYDDEEAEQDSNKKMMSRLIANIEHGQADDDELEEQLTNMLKTTKRIVGQKKERISEKVADKLAAAKARAAGLESLQKVQVPAPEKDAVIRAAEAVMKGTAIEPLEVTAEMRARQAANKLNERLNYMGGEAKQINMGDDWEYYEEEMDINDFPQQVRYKICSRESVGHIAEFADVGLSVRGTHYPNGREPRNGDRRLHLLIEARSEHNLRRAKEEIIRIMKDSLRQLSQGPRGGMQARYRVQ